MGVLKTILCVGLVCCVGSLPAVVLAEGYDPDDSGGRFAACDVSDETVICLPVDPPQAGIEKPRGFTALANPAVGRYIKGTRNDPLAAFNRRPLDHFILPEGGLFLDETRDGSPHYAVDYANPDDYLNGQKTFAYPIGPGYVTARSTCLLCYVDGDAQGRVEERWPQYNFGFGTFVLVETPYNAYVSIYTMYAHLARDFVSLGDYITPDDPLGVVGTTGYSQSFHLHLEIRYGPPGRFWNMDFAQWSTLDRWMATMYVNPAWLVFPENHALFVEYLDAWQDMQPHPLELP